MRHLPALSSSGEKMDALLDVVMLEIIDFIALACFGGVLAV
jgi:hypothetical protein